jgi:hypothetical protein
LLRDDADAMAASRSGLLDVAGCTSKRTGDPKNGLVLDAS